MPKNPTKRQQKEQENADCMGGMRNPSRAVSRNGALRLTSRKVKGVVEAFLKEKASRIDIATLFGSEGYQGPDPEEVLHLREIIRIVLEAPVEPTLEYRWGAPSPLQGEILHAWIVQGQDPEILMRDWIQTGAPFSINVDIPGVGVFPKVEDATDPLTLTSVQEAKGAHVQNCREKLPWTSSQRVPFRRWLSS